MIPSRHQMKGTVNMHASHILVGQNRLGNTNSVHAETQKIVFAKKSMNHTKLL